jgi:opacity protein-like surface antigen
MARPQLSHLIPGMVASMACSAAFAVDEASPWYVTATAGFTGQSDQRLDFTSPTGGTASATAPLGSGFAAGGAFGRTLGQSWRLEAEFMYQSVDHDGVAFAAGGPRGDGNFASTSVALNGLYDFNLFGSSSVRTYAGAGLVYLTEVDIDFEQGATELSYSGSDAGFQLLFGARYDLSGRFFVDAGLRYLLVSSVKLDAEVGAGGRIVADYEPWAATVSAGFRF